MSFESVNTVYGPMRANLNCEKLIDLCEESGVQTGPFGSQLHQEDYVADGTPIITVEHLSENSIVHENLPRVSDEDKARLSKYILKKGDIVFSRVGSVDRRAIVKAAEDGWLFSGRCLRVRSKSEILNAEWLSYFFGLPAFKNYIRGIAVGATMPSINTKILSDVPIYFPEIDVQRSAANALSLIDERITLLRETNITLEAIAQALFKSWFVDFDPVRAKSEGKLPEGMDEATAALFPDAFEETDLGMVPRGWSLSCIADIADVIDCLHSKKPNLIDSPFLFLQLSNIRDDGLLDTSDVAGISETDYKKWTSRVEVQSGDCVITNVGRVGAVSQIPEGFKAAMGRNMTAIRLKSEFSYPAYLIELLQSSWMRVEINAKTDVGTILNALNVKSIPQLRCITAPHTVMTAFENNARPLRRKMEQNISMAQTLSSLRDTLLPRLISGQLRIADAEAELEKVTA
jgi:type I restriction enzyme S subunit